MTRIHYDKLIRDRIPEIIRQSGKTYEVAILDDEAYRLALATKLVEEAQETREAAAAGGDLAKEIADLYEVIDALIAAFDMDREAILQLQSQRRAQRGAFDKRLNLLWVE